MRFLYRVNVIVGTRGDGGSISGEAYRYQSLDMTQLHVFSCSGVSTQTLKDGATWWHPKTTKASSTVSVKDPCFYARHIRRTMPVLPERPKPGLPMHASPVYPCKSLMMLP